MKFSITKSEFNFFKENFDCGMDSLKNINTVNDIVTFYVDDENIDDFQNDMDSDIINRGLDNQETVNDIGIEMYCIYDKLMYE